MNDRRRHRAFTLLDLLLTVAIIAILATVAVPALRPNDSLKLISAATILTADIEFAQSATLEDPANPTIVRVDSDKPGYWLALASDPETPIQRPMGGAYEVTFGEGANDFLDNLGLKLDGPADSVVFDGFGRLNQPDDVTVVLSSPTGELAVRVAATTGSVYVGE